MGHEVPAPGRDRVDEGPRPRLGHARPDVPKAWLPRRGRPPEGMLTEDEARRRAARVPRRSRAARRRRSGSSFDRCLDAFLEHCEEKALSPTTMRTYRQIVAEVRNAGARLRRAATAGAPSTSTPTSSRTTATISSRSAASPAARSTSAAPCCRASSRSPAAAFASTSTRSTASSAPQIRDAGDLEVYSVEEVWALVALPAQRRTITRQPEAQRSTGARARRARAPRTDSTPRSSRVAALCGLRRSEIIGLRWRAVLFEQRAIVVRRGFTDVGGDRLPKGQRVHSVPMAPQVHDMLLRCGRTTSSPTRACSRARTAARWTARRSIAATSSPRSRPSVRPLRFHDLRHTFGTQAIAGGANVHDVQQWMGHRHLSTTMRYVHYRPQPTRPTCSASASKGPPASWPRCSATRPP